MKHKAQESLNELCSYAMVCQEDYDLDELRNPIQDLIDCQLTYNQIMHIIAKMCGQEYEISIEEMVDIGNKLVKQKEMWESEDE